jgi:phosphohistidine phosphatase
MRGLDPRPPVQVLPALAPGTPASRIISALAVAGRGASRIALVGHEPGLGELAARLVGARTPFVFKKGGIARIDVDGWAPADAGRLIWLATPKLLRHARA